MALMVHVTSLVSAKMPTTSGMAVLGLLPCGAGGAA